MGKIPYPPTRGAVRLGDEVCDNDWIEDEAKLGESLRISEVSLAGLGDVGFRANLYSEMGDEVLFSDLAGRTEERRLVDDADKAFLEGTIEEGEFGDENIDTDEGKTFWRLEISDRGLKRAAKTPWEGEGRGGRRGEEGVIRGFPRIVSTCG